MAAASSSTPFFGMREEDQNKISHHQQQQQSSSTPTSSVAPPPQKKKRNLPGTPNPDAEVIALSPKTLMATNRFICEVCNKGFQREQNLQLHRRGHNLPWKLRQKTTKEVKRKVYLCPEPTCVHHDPSRALGDLTGIKKHFCRKHGEKKWKCDKCSKRYAVQSDWKAHSKTCGTREYRCDCGTLFSRRDSFITHRAFCDALAQESARLPTGLNTIGSHLYGSSSNMGLGLSQVGSQMSSLQEPNHSSTDLLRLRGPGGAQFDHLISPSTQSSYRPTHPTAGGPSSAFFLPPSNPDFNEEPQTHAGLLQNKSFHGLMQLPDLQPNTNNSSPAAASLFNLGFFSNNGASATGTSINNTNNNNPNNNNSTSSHLSSSGLLMPDQFANGGGEPANLFSNNLLGGGDHMGSGVSSLYNSSMQSDSVIPQMSATALLQKAAQMGATTSGSGASLLRGFGGSSSSGGKPVRGSFGGGGGGGGENLNENHFQDLMNSLTNGGVGGGGGGSSSMFGGGSGGMNTFSSGHEQEAGGFGGFNASRISMEQQQQQQHGSNLCNMDEAKLHQNFAMSLAGSDRLTRDFLGVAGMVRSMSGSMSQRDQHHPGIDIGSLDPEMKSAAAAAANRSFGGGNLQ